MARKTIERTGEIRVNNQGCKMKIIEYVNKDNIIVEFEDGLIKRSCYKSFKNGAIRNPNFKKRYDDKIGEVNYNNFGSKTTIVEFNGSNEVVVEFENGYRVKTTDSAFRKGTIKSPYERRTYGVGYLGEGKYKTKENGKLTPQYKKWSGMLKRCYYKEKDCYKDVIVCEEWHNFNTFAKWYDENYYFSEEELALDKDILSDDNNKIYSPSTCIFVPVKLNSFISSLTLKSNSELSVVGVSKKYKKWECKIQYENKTIFCKLYKSLDEAKKQYDSIKYEIFFNMINEMRDNKDILEEVYQKIINSKIVNDYYEVA